MTTTFETLLWSVRDGIATIAINRPEARNALSPKVIEELNLAFEEAERQPDVRVVVLTGAGDKAFCAGADLMGGGMSGEMPTPIQRHEMSRSFVRLFLKMRDLSKPIVARVNGYALAGGLGLMAGCDLVVASSNSQFGTPEINIGLFPYVILVTLSRSVPRKKLLELVLTGDRIGADEAKAIGLVNRVVPPEKLDEAVTELAQKLASKSPVILRLGRRAFYAMSDMDFESGLEYMNGALTINGLAEDMVEGVMAFFQKRPPQWKGR
ncbi:MAG: enoyl-CoA hydratase/isomerase family protein [Nitrospirae bacterium]|nr:enoyl-CoA hydratase/isomerase family protein [Nitrospirota bacterium]